MGRRFRFAPISSAPSTRLALVIWLFRANAVIEAALLVFLIVNLAFGFVKRPDSIPSFLFHLVVLGFWVVANWWIAQQLETGQKRGLVVGVVVFALGLIQPILRVPIDWIGISFGVVVLIALASVWAEMTPRKAAGER